MSDLYNRIETLCHQRNMTITSLCRLADCSRASLSDLKAGRKQSLSAQTLGKLAACLGVTVDCLLGKENPAPGGSTGNGVTDEAIKFALFGGDSEITDEMYEEVRNFAAFVKRREEEKRRKD